MAAVYADLTDASQRYALALSIEGCEYVFCTGGVADVTFSADRDADWCTDVLEWRLLASWLDVDPRKGIGWTERVKPIDGDLEVSGITFSLHDAAPTTGGAAGSPVMSYLAAREEIASTPLAASISDTATTITVSDGSIFGTSDFVIWIDREAVYCDARSGNTITVNAAGRGALGSKARAHYVDATTSYAPEVFPTCPFLERRRVVLWMGPVVNGVMTDPVPVWRGFVQTGAPRLASDGARWELFCEHITALLGDIPIGAPTAACTVQGYYTTIPDTFYVLVAGRTHGGVDVNGIGFMGDNAAGSPLAYYPTLANLCDTLSRQVNTTIAGSGATSSIHLTAAGSTLTLQGTLTDGDNFWGQIGALWRSPTRVSRMGDSATGNLPPVTFEDFPPALVSASVSPWDPQPIHMASVAQLPATNWPRQGTIGTTRSAAVLVATTGDYRIELVPNEDDVAGDTVVDTTHSTVKGWLRLYRGHNLLRDADVAGGVDGVLLNANGYKFLVAPLTFALALTIDTTAWPDGLAQVVNDTVLVGTAAQIDVDARDWDFSRSGRITAALPANLARRSWLFDGTATVRDVLGMNEQFSGGAPGLRRSRIAPDVFLPPLRSQAFDAAHTFNGGSDPGHLEKPTFAIAPDGIANVFGIKIGNASDSGTTTWVLNEQRSVAKYGPRRRVDLEIRGVEVTAELLAQGPRALQTYLTTRLAALWSQPVKTAKIKRPARLVDSVYLMDDVLVAEDWLLPNASGSRGWDGVRATVIGREVKLLGPGAGITYEVMKWPFSQTAGWSPCARLASSTAGTKTVTIAVSYIDGTTVLADGPAPTDYAGSNQPGYADADVGSGTVADDGGTGYFEVGDVCELIERDSTTPLRETVTIATVNPATKTITFVSAQSASWAAILGGGGIADLRYVGGSYGSITNDQSTYAWVGDRASGLVASTDPDTQWSA